MRITLVTLCVELPELTRLISGNLLWVNCFLVQNAGLDLIVCIRYYSVFGVMLYINIFFVYTNTNGAYIKGGAHNYFYIYFANRIGIAFRYSTWPIACITHNATLIPIAAFIN